MSILSAVRPINTTESELGGAAYTRAGNPVGVPQTLPAFPGVDAKIPTVPDSTLLYDRPGKQTNATVQYNRVVPMASPRARAETEGLDIPGTLAWNIAYDPPGELGIGVSSVIDLDPAYIGTAAGARGPQTAINALRTAYGDTSPIGKLDRLVTQNYITSVVKPADIPVSAGTPYRDVFGTQSRQRITHMINVASRTSADDYGQVGLNMDFTRNADNTINNNINQLGDAPLGKFLNDTLLYSNLRNTPLVGSTLYIGDTGMAVARDGFALTPAAMATSPFLLPLHYADYAAAQPRFAHTTEAFPVTGYTYTCGRAATRIESAYERTGKDDETLYNPFHAEFHCSDDVRMRLYQAFEGNFAGLLSPFGIGPWKPDGFVINKYSTYGLDKEAEAALDAQQHGLYNICVGGQVIATQFSSRRQPADSVLAHSVAYKSVLDSMLQAQRLLTLPGDSVYVLVIGQVTQDSDPIVDGGTPRGPDGANRLVNVRLALSTSHDMDQGACPVGKFGVTEAPVFISSIPAGDFRIYEDDPRVVVDAPAYGAGAPKRAIQQSFAGVGVTKIEIKQSNALYARILYYLDSANIPGNTLFYKPAGGMVFALSINRTLGRASVANNGAQQTKANGDGHYTNLSNGRFMPGLEDVFQTTTREDGNVRMRSIGLGDDEVIVGGWELGVVTDNAASRAIPNGAHNVLLDSSTYGLTVMTSITWRNGLELHQRYWSRGSDVDVA